MVKKAILGLFGLIMAAGMAAPQKANAAEVVVGVAPRPYVYVAPGPVVVAPGPYYRPYAYYRGYYGPRYVVRYGYHPYRRWYR